MIIKKEKEQIKILRKEIKRREGLDSCSFIKVESRKDGRYAIFNIKSKNNCGYKNCDIDDFKEVKL